MVERTGQTWEEKIAQDFTQFWNRAWNTDNKVKRIVIVDGVIAEQVIPAALDIVTDITETLEENNIVQEDVCSIPDEVAAFMKLAKPARIHSPVDDSTLTSPNYIVYASTIALITLLWKMKVHQYVTKYGPAAWTKAKEVFTGLADKTNSFVINLLVNPQETMEKVKVVSKEEVEEGFYVPKGNAAILVPKTQADLKRIDTAVRRQSRATSRLLV